jgi:hypothetical protein
VSQSDFRSQNNEKSKLYSIVRKLPNQTVENPLEINTNKTVHTIHMKTISGPIPFVYHYKLIPFRGTTTVILNAEINKNEVSSLMGRKIKSIPQIILKKMILKEVKRNLYSLKIDLEKMNSTTQTQVVI